MKKERKREGQQHIEILAPAGSFDSLKAAVLCGADAVYAGGSRFGARAFADNFSEQQLLAAIDYVHLHGRKLYLTVNTLLKEEELSKELYHYLLPYYRQGLDAVIVQDTGVLYEIKRWFPDLAVHASTQMTITNALGAKFLKNAGAERVVPARELNLEEIKEIVETTGMEVECFVHGALCYCYSGQCLLSSLIGGRSGNRGQCAQPCRLPYQAEGRKKPEYLLSPKDICTLDGLPGLIEAGIYSFKIEGRMKKPEYVAAVTSMYRKYTDLYLDKGREGYIVADEDKEILLDIYNRGGFHPGYYHVKNGREMLSLKRPNHAGVPAVRIEDKNGRKITASALTDLHAQDIIELPGDRESYTLGQGYEKGDRFTFAVSRRQDIKPGTVLYRTRNEWLLGKIHDGISNRKLQEKIKGTFILSTEKPAILTVEKDGISVSVTGETGQRALNSPLDKERVLKQLCKTGSTPFVFEETDVRIEGNVFLPMQSLNELRREALLKLEEKICLSFRKDEVLTEKKPDVIIKDVHKEQGFYVYAETDEQYEEVRKHESVSRIYLADTVTPVASDKEQYLVTPYIFRTGTKARLDTLYGQYGDLYDGTLVHNFESYEYLEEQNYEKPIVLDYNMYQFNRSAKTFWNGKADSFTVPLELNNRELSELGIEDSELIVYGYLPMMVSAQCLKKTLGQCDKKRGLIRMKDRRQKEFAVKHCCENCYNVIYNADPLVLLDQEQEILKLRPKALRLHFTLEDKQEVGNVLQLYEERFQKGNASAKYEGPFTRGHFKRGVK